MNEAYRAERSRVVHGTTRCGHLRRTSPDKLIPLLIPGDFFTTPKEARAHLESQGLRPCNTGGCFGSLWYEERDIPPISLPDLEVFSGKPEKEGWLPFVCPYCLTLNWVNPEDVHPSQITMDGNWIEKPPLVCDHCRHPIGSSFARTMEKTASLLKITVIKPESLNIVLLR